MNYPPNPISNYGFKIASTAQAVRHRSTPHTLCFWCFCHIRRRVEEDMTKLNRGGRRHQQHLGVCDENLSRGAFKSPAWQRVTIVSVDYLRGLSRFNQLPAVTNRPHTHTQTDLLTHVWTEPLSLIIHDMLQ